MRNRQLPSGFTLVEVLIASVLIVILLGAFLQLMASQARVASEETQDSTAQSGLIMTIETMLPLLEEGNFRGDVLPNPSSVEFYVPMKDSFGKIVTPLEEDPNTGRPALLMGAGEPGNMTLGDYYQITFQQEARADQLIDEATLARSNGVLGVDLNQDGDKTDKFMYGTMILRRFNSAGTQINERFLGGRIAMPWPGGTIFSRSGTLLTVNLISLDLRTKTEDSRIRTTQTKINLRGQKGLTYDPTP